MDEKWIWAAVAVVAGFVVGGILSRVVRAILSRPRRADAVKNNAGVIASLFFSVAVIVGLITALGIVNRDSLDTLPEDLVDYLPNALSAAIVLIIANVAATFVVAAVERSLGHVSPTIRARVPPILRTTILFAGVLIVLCNHGPDGLDVVGRRPRDEYGRGVEVPDQAARLRRQQIIQHVNGRRWGHVRRFLKDPRLHEHRPQRPVW